MLLAGYSYNIKFKPTSSLSNADGLSQLPLKNASLLGYLPNVDVAQIDTLPVAATKLESADSILSKVLYYTILEQESFKPYYDCHLELSIEGGTIFGVRVVIPLVLCQRVLAELHQSHQGGSENEGSSSLLFLAAWIE